MNENDTVHRFANGVQVYDRHLMPAQRERYRRNNVHEADEEGVFTAIIDALPATGCYVNIGSAIGYYVILARRRQPALTVHAVEPLAQFRDWFRENLRLNGLAEDICTLHALGVAGRGGTLEFVEKGYESRVLPTDAGSLSRLVDHASEWVKGLLGGLGVARYAAGRGRLTRIRTITLDELIQRVAEPVDLLQMDVQGRELDILEGGPQTLSAGLVRTFLIGTHGRLLHRHCLEILREAGYTIEHEEANTRHQPDGIIVASRGVTRLSPGAAG